MSYIQDLFYRLNGVVPKRILVDDIGHGCVTVDMKVYRGIYPAIYLKNHPEWVTAIVEKITPTRREYGHIIQILEYQKESKIYDGAYPRYFDVQKDEEQDLYKIYMEYLPNAGKFPQQLTNDEFASGFVESILDINKGLGIKTKCIGQTNTLNRWEDTLRKTFVEKDIDPSCVDFSFLREALQHQPMVESHNDLKLDNVAFETNPTRFVFYDFDRFESNIIGADFHVMVKMYIDEPEESSIFEKSLQLYSEATNQPVNLLRLAAFYYSIFTSYRHLKQFDRFMHKDFIAFTEKEALVLISKLSQFVDKEKRSLNTMVFG